MRRIFLIFILVGVIGYAGWYVFVQRKNSTENNEHPGIFQSFFPKRDSGEVSNDTTSTSPSGVIQGNDESSESPFKQISPSPVAGFTFFRTSKIVTTPSPDPKKAPTKQTVLEPIIRYVARSNGYVYEVKKGDIPIQISNIYIPNIYEALFADNGTTALLRFLRGDNTTIATYSVPIPPENKDGTRTQLPGTYLPDNIENIALSADTKTVARLSIEKNEAILATTTTKNAARKELLMNAFHEWIPLWNSSQIYLQTKASGLADGFLYRVNTLNKRLVHVLGGIKGLTASISPQGSYILYSESSDNGFETKLLTVKTGAIKNLHLAILPEKCAWTSNENLFCAGNSSVNPGTYPDDWYEGAITLTDKFYQILPKAGVVETLAEFAPSSFDAISLIADESEKMLYFIDKSSGFLWQLSY